MVKIIDIDQNGEIINEPNWDEWVRESVEEVHDDNHNLLHLISHCRPYTKEELQARMMSILDSTKDEDIINALCELAEQQAQYEDDVNNALCELYELIEGVMNDG